MTHYYTEQINKEKLNELSDLLTTLGFKPSYHKADPRTEGDNFSEQFNPNTWTSELIDVRLNSNKHNLFIDTKVKNNREETPFQKQTILKIMNCAGADYLVGAVSTEKYSQSYFS
ncbi:MAG: hypothetical protein ACP5N3_02345 [Candidatus Nanoarchaeia archaeon]